MKLASRLPLVLVVLIGLFLAGVALAVAGLLSLRDPYLVVVCGVAVLAGVMAAAIAYAAVRSEPLEDYEERPDDAEAPAQAPAGRVHTLPIANLPAPYLQAVMKAVHANRAAMKDQWKAN